MKNLNAFEPNAERIFFLDDRMRSRLADSLDYIFAQANGHLDVSKAQFQNFLVQLKTRPASPLAFSFYSDAVLAIEDDNLELASVLLRDLINLPAHSGRMTVSAIQDPRHSAVGKRYAQVIENDSSLKIEVFPPSPQTVENCRAQIQNAFALMDAGDPELAAEIRALLREIVLAAGSEDPKAFTFDGASSFMLWGAILLNANRRTDPLEMVQMIAHESAHNLLFGLSADGPLVENLPDELFPSPLRPDLRPMDGIYHATFVTARMHRAVKQLLENGALPDSLKEKAHKELDGNVRLFTKGIETVERHGKLTPLGRDVICGATDYMKKCG